MNHHLLFAIKGETLRQQGISLDSPIDQLSRLIVPMALVPARQNAEDTNSRSMVGFLAVEDD